MSNDQFKERRCYQCDKGTIRMTVAAWFHSDPPLEIPTCDKCGAEWVNDTVCEAITAALERSDK